MPIQNAQIFSISPDTGDGDSGDDQDFLTQGRSLTISGLAAGNGDMSVWLVDSAIPGGVEMGAVTISPTSGVWSFTFPSGLRLADGNYTVELKDGTQQGAPVLTTQAFTVDNQTVSVGIDPIEGGTNVLTGPEAVAGGLQVTGTWAGSENASLVSGEDVDVQIRDSLTNDVLVTQSGIAAGDGTWAVNFSASQAEMLQANGINGYYVTAGITDEAGNVGKAQHHQFTSFICFMPGTRVRTPDGEANIENLKRGDFVVTADGRTMPISWVGRQTVSRIFADPLRVLPIRIKAGALGENMPSRDLLLSPDHAVMVGNVLVQAGALVNDMSIIRETGVPQAFTYFHLELDDHSLILAENTPAETFIDNVDRLAFDNWKEHEALYPDGKAIVEMSYPRAKAHRQVPRAIREKLGERAVALYADTKGQAPLTEAARR